MTDATETPPTQVKTGVAKLIVAMHEMREDLKRDVENTRQELKSEFQTHRSDAIRWRESVDVQLQRTWQELAQLSATVARTAALSAQQTTDIAQLQAAATKSGRVSGLVAGGGAGAAVTALLSWLASVLASGVSH